MFSVNFDWVCDVIFMASKQYRSGCFIEQVLYNMPDDSSKNYAVCHNTAHVVKLVMDLLQLLNVLKSQHNVTPTRHETCVARQNIFVMQQKC